MGTARGLTADGVVGSGGQRSARWPSTREPVPGVQYIDSPRHANYVHAATFQQALGDLRRRLGWPDPSETFYEDLRVDAVRPASPRPFADSVNAF